MQLIIDIGNTSAKAAVFHGSEMKEKFYFNKLGLDEIEQLLADFEISKAIFSNVAMANTTLVDWLSARTRLHVLNTASKLPFTNAYHTPDTLGADRIANAAGAVALYPGSNCLVIDVGTCIKFDMVDQNAVYQGGSISPGISLRFKAMHDYTDRLPLLKAEKMPADFIGKSTGSSMQNGVLFGILNEIKGFIEMYRNTYAPLQIVLTGGDAHFFEAGLKNTIFANPDLTLTGLNKILELNDQPR